MASGDEEAAACWAPSGSCRATGHAAIGGLTGGLGGAVGAGVSSVTAPVFIDFLRQNEVPEVLVQALAASAAAAAGSALGGAAGAAGAYNETTNNAVVAVPFIVEALVAAGEAAILACARSPKCVGLVGATVLNALTINSASNQDGSGSAGSGPTGGNQADTYGTPPNGASPPPDGDGGKKEKAVSNSNDVRVEVKNTAEPYGNSGQAFNVSSDSELQNLFDRITANSESVAAPTYNGSIRVLPDGTRIGLRATSGTGGRTIDIFPRSGRPYKVHIQP